MVKILKICAKTSDMFAATLVENGETLKDYDGYVPDFMPGEHCGDYIELDINIDTGQILNWTKPTEKQIEEFIKGEDEDEIY